MTQTDFNTTTVNIITYLLNNFNKNISKQDANFHFDMHHIRDINDQRYEAMYTPYHQRYDKQHNILNDYFANKLNQFPEKSDKRFEQQQ